MIRLTKHTVVANRHEISFVANQTGYTYLTHDKLTYNEIMKIGYIAPGKALNLAKRTCELIDKEPLNPA